MMTHKQIDHDFKNQQLSYGEAPNYQPCIKLSFFFNKLPDVSYEQFHHHWETVHADLTVAAKDFKACKIQRYVQFHQTPEMKEKAKSLGLEHVDFDGCSEIWVDDFVRLPLYCGGADTMPHRSKTGMIGWHYTRCICGTTHRANIILTNNYRVPSTPKQCSLIALTSWLCLSTSVDNNPDRCAQTDSCRSWSATIISYLGMLFRVRVARTVSLRRI